MRSARIHPRLATAGPSIAISAGEGVLGFPGGLRLPPGRLRPLAGRLAGAVLAAVFVAYPGATAVPSTRLATPSPAPPRAASDPNTPHRLPDQPPLISA